MSIRNPVMHKAERRPQPPAGEWVIPNTEANVPDRVKQGLDAPTEITVADIVAIARARKLLTQ